MEFTISRSSLLSRGGIYCLEIKIYLAEIDFTKWRLNLQYLEQIY